MDDNKKDDKFKKEIKINNNRSACLLVYFLLHITSFF